MAKICRRRGCPSAWPCVRSDEAEALLTKNDKVFAQHNPRLLQKIHDIYFGNEHIKRCLYIWRKQRILFKFGQPFRTFMNVFKSKVPEEANVASDSPELRT